MIQSVLKGLLDMKTKTESDFEAVRFLAVNYTRLQGLRCMPVGIFAIFITLWVNLLNINLERNGMERLIPVMIIGLFCLVLNLMIDRYYKKTFGSVSMTSRTRLIEALTVIFYIALVLGALWLDVDKNLKFSAVGLVMALGMMTDYLRMVYFARFWYKPFTILNLICSLVIAAVSILPVLGFDGWWYQIGMKSELMGMFIIVGSVMIIFGLISHHYFIKTLPKGYDHE